MANPEHVAIVNQGAEAIAAWREAHPGEQLDLLWSNLQGANFQGATLQGATLRAVRLQGANFQGADLRAADLRAANLQGATLGKADLQEATLQGADLQGAVLSDANLTGAHITRETNFDGVTVNGNTKGLGPWVFNPEKYILREIEFPREYKQAGIGVMNYFAEVMEQKYPDIPVNVQIAQEGMLVRMTIETDDGVREIVEQTLEEYALVISGKRQPAGFLDDAISLMRLENKFDVVKMELQAERRANRLLEMYGSEQKARIEHLETEVRELRQIVGNSLAGMQKATHQAQQTTHLLASGAINHNRDLSVLFVRHMERVPDNDTLRQVISTIQAVAERALATTDQDALSGADKVALTQAATDIHEADSTYWRAFKAELIDFFRGVGSGVGGNAATEILQILNVL